ncbi:MAG: TlpA family protein disulfide reductase [Solirubrobacteraceae bacterium]|nr:TlpA family protein disulfide reductase [Solirubrobacteraceae bacterium]
MLRRLPLAICLTALMLLATGCGDKSTVTRPTLSQVKPDVTGADPRLVKISEQSSLLISGGEPAFEARLKSLKGLPVVANKWASWCAPCIAEAPDLQKTVKKYGDRVAFLGVNVADSNAKAKQFLRKYPQAYPSYIDLDLKIAKQFPPAGSPPVTNIYDAEGRLVRSVVGQIQSAAELDEIIERYAGPIAAGPNN